MINYHICQINGRSTIRNWSIKSVQIEMKDDATISEVVEDV